MTLAKASYMMAGQTSEQMDATRDQLAAMVTGWSVEEVENIARETMHTVVTPAIYHEDRELIKFHQEAGHVVVIISASEATLVRLITLMFGVENIITTVLINVIVTILGAIVP